MFAFTFAASALLAAGWFASFIYAIRKFGKRGLLVLIGGVPALWVIYVLLVVPFACLFTHDCL